MLVPITWEVLMEPLTLLLVPGVIGGLLLALWLAFASRSSADPNEQHPNGALLDSINMANIRVAGVGGLGMMAGALLTAYFVPMVGLSVALGGVAGVTLAIGLILWRRRAGPLTSSGQRPGASSTLDIDGQHLDSSRADSERNARPTEPKAQLRLA